MRWKRVGVFVRSEYFHIDQMHEDYQKVSISIHSYHRNLFLFFFFFLLAVRSTLNKFGYEKRWRRTGFVSCSASIF